TRSGTRFDRALAVDMLENAIPRTLQDPVVIFVNCIGLRNGRREQASFMRAVRAVELFGRVWPAIELTTAAGVCAMVDLHRLGKIRRTGFVRQEEVSLAEFNQTVFGLGYENPPAIERQVAGR
ncbi:MAG: saccharopine dehydrogenase family protein, partial [Phycisphaerae bacterium]|nr:saccharopine dehydrogenase family protein [Phycisphaerae bacterium]